MTASPSWGTTGGFWSDSLRSGAIVDDAIWLPEEDQGPGTVTGTGAYTQDAQTLAATGQVIVSGTGAYTQDAQTLTSSVSIIVTGAGASTQDDQTLVGEADVIVSSAGAYTQGDHTLSATGTVFDPPIVGTGAFTQDDQTLAADGDVIVSAVGAFTQDAQTLAGDGDVIVTGTGTHTQADQTAAGTGAVVIHSELVSGSAAVALSQTGINNSPSYYNSTVSWAQSYKPTTHKLATKVRWGLSKTGSPSSYLVGHIWADDGSETKPSGAPLYTSYNRVQASSLTGSQTLYDFDFSHAHLNPNVRYWIGVEHVTTVSQSDFSNRVDWYLSTSGAVADSRLASFGLGTWFAEVATRDGVMEIYSQDAFITQDAQTLSAEGDTLTGGTSATTQEDHTLAATGEVIVTGVGAFTQEDQTVAAEGTVVHSAESILYLDDSNDDSGPLPRPRTSIVPATPLNIPVPEVVVAPNVITPAPVAPPPKKKKVKAVDSGLRRDTLDVPGVIPELRVLTPAVARAKRRVAVDKAASPPVAVPPPSTPLLPDWRDEVDVEALASFLAARSAKMHREATAAAVAAFIKEHA